MPLDNQFVTLTVRIKRCGQAQPIQKVQIVLNLCTGSCLGANQGVWPLNIDRRAQTLTDPILLHVALAPYSLDMNLIKNLWAYLKLELHQWYPDTATLSGWPGHIRQKISKQVHEVWWLIVEGVLYHLIDSMPHQVKALIKACSWYTQWMANQIFASQNLDSGLTNIQKAWFRFDKASSKIRGRIFAFDYPIRQWYLKNPWWPIRSLIFSHK